MQLVQIHTAIAIVTLALFGTGCGTTSNFKATQAAGQTSGVNGIQKYCRVSVLDFGDQTPTKGKPGDPANTARAQKMVARGRQFADLIAGELTKTKAFDSVAGLSLLGRRVDENARFSGFGGEKSSLQVGSGREDLLSEAVGLGR